MYRAALLIALAVGAGTAQADPFQIEDVTSPASLALSQLKPRTIAFNDRPASGAADGLVGFVRFEDWAQINPLQKRLLSLHAGYVEPTINVTKHGLTKPHNKKLSLYMAEARFLLDRPAASIDLSRYATLSFIESIDPAIKHEPITPSDVLPLKDPHSTHNLHPERRWCVGEHVICMRSRYQLEGKFPTIVRLINKVEEGNKVADFFEFQSELRVLRQPVDQMSLAQLTGVQTTIAGVLEQSIFHVNQVMQFGKLLAVLQAHPTDPNKTVATVYLALAIETDVLELRRDYERYPVLRNLVPAQVLLGKSSFNTGASLSAGLPVFTRTRLTAIANILNQAGP